MTNVCYVKNILANCDGNLYLPILQLQRVELHCKLQEKLHGVTGPSAYVHFCDLVVIIRNVLKSHISAVFKAFIYRPAVFDGG